MIDSLINSILRITLLDASRTKPDDAVISSGGRFEQHDKDTDDDVSKEKEEKLNSYFCSNSISPQSTVTQLTDTPLNGKSMISPN